MLTDRYCIAAQQGRVHLIWWRDTQEAQQRKELGAAPAKAALASKAAAGAAAGGSQRVRTLAEVEAAVLEVVAELVGDDVDVGEPLAGQGLDSLAAMELRQKLQVHCHRPSSTHRAPVCTQPYAACDL